MIENGHANDSEDFQSKLIDKCDEICRLLFLTIKDKLQVKYGCFQIFQLNFLIDSDLYPYLLKCKNGFCFGKQP